MKVGFLETYQNLKLPEKENILRIKKVFEKFGHEFFVLSPSGQDENGKHADLLGLDFVFTPDNAVDGMKIMPDCLSLSVGWVPCGYLLYSKFQSFASGIDEFDGYVPAFESVSTDYILNNFANNFIKIDDYFYPSVSKDSVIEPKLLENYKIFYVGINLDKGKSKGRHYSLLKALDDKNILQLHGPDKIGDIVCWEGFKNYSGEIPFDGVSILNKINEAGICLAFQSKIHNIEEYVTNRIYEACASGAVIITDDNPKVRNIFKDSIYYVDIFQEEEKIIDDVLNIYNFIIENPKLAYEKAKKAQEIFLNNFTLEKSVENIILACDKVYKDINDKEKQIELVDVIAFVDNQQDFENINKQLSKQYYKNIKVYFSSKINLDTGKLNYNYEIINTKENFYGKRFIELKDKLSGKYFAFINGISDMQSRHLLKLVNKMNESENLYCFSGTYLKDYDNGGKYEVLNDKSIELSNYFALMANISYSDENKQIMTSFDMENMYALHSFIFKNEILNILKDKELLNLRRAIHLYMSLSAIYKKQDLGAVVSSISCGYTTLAPITEIDNKKYYIDINAESYLDFKRCEGLSLMEMYAIFQKYNLMRFQKFQTKKNKY